MPRIKKILIASIILTSIFLMGFLNVVKASSFNKQLNYQAKLTNTANVAMPDGSYHMFFRLYGSLSGTDIVWFEDRSQQAGDLISVTNGLFSVLLGSSTPLTGISFDQTLFLEVQICGTASSTCEILSPRKKLGTVPSAFEADKVDGLSSEQFLRSDAVNSTSTTSTFLTVTQSGSGKIAEFFGPNSTSVLSAFSTGKVGIGTTTPWAKLSVNNYSSGANSTPLFTIASSTGTGATSTVFHITNTGLVGIGTTSPWGLLSVNHGGISGPTFIVGSSTATSLIVDSNSGNVGIGMTAPTARLHVAGPPGGISALFTDSTNSTLAIGHTGGSLTRIYGTAGSTLSLSGNDFGASAAYIALNGSNVTMSDAGNATLAISFVSNPANTAQIFGTVGSNVYLGANNAGVMFISTLGNVGIGTTTPSAMLAVRGGGFFDGGTITASGLIATSTLTVSGTTATSTFSTGGLTVGTSQFVVQQTSGNVGIGTTTPLSLLDLFKANGDAAISLTSSSTSNIKYAWTLGADLSDAGKFKISSSTALGSSDRLVIDGNGNIGIGGVVTSYTTLSLKGNVGQYSAYPTSPGVPVGSSLYLGDDNFYSADYFNSAPGLSAVYSAAQAVAADLAFYTFTGAANSRTERMRIINEGKVGIGTTTPNWNLQIASSTKTFLTLSDFSAGAPINGKHWFMSSMGGNFYVGTSSDSLNATSTYMSMNYGTTTFSTLLNITSSTATSTAANGWNLTAGCFAVNGTCVGGGGASLTGSTGQVAYFSSANTAVGTSTLTIHTNSYVGIGTTTPQVALHIGTASTTQITNYSKSLFVSGELEVAENAFFGPMEFPSDSGVLSWIDMPVSSSVTAYTPQSYTARLGGTDILTVYGLASGAAGGVSATTTRVGIGTTTPWATLSVLAPYANSVPAFVVATSSGMNPLFYVSATSTGKLDWARVAVGTTTTFQGSGLRDQFTVAGRMYSTWRQLFCDFPGTSIGVAVTNDTGLNSIADQGICGVFGFEMYVDSFLSAASTSNPGHVQIHVGQLHSTLNDGGRLSAVQGLTAASSSPVLEVWARIATSTSYIFTTGTNYIIGFATSSRVWGQGSGGPTAQNSLPDNGYYFVASSTNTWIVNVRNQDTEVFYQDTNIATSTNFQKLRIEATDSNVVFLINGAVVAEYTGTVPSYSMTPIMSVGIFTANALAKDREMDISLIRLWSDDPPGGFAGGGSSPAASAPESDLASAEALPEIGEIEESPPSLPIDFSQYSEIIAPKITTQSLILASGQEGKKEISFLADADYENILTKIASTSVATYLYNNDPECSGLSEVELPSLSEGSSTSLNASACAKRIGLIAEQAPLEILSVDGKGVDLYKMSSFMWAGMKALAAKQNEQQKQIAALELRLENLEALALSGQGTEVYPNDNLGPGLTASSFAWILGRFENIGVKITDGIVKAAELIADKVVARKVITEYFEMKDSATGDVWCVSIAHGEMVKFKGTCGEISSEVEPPAGGSTSADESAAYVEPVSGCTDKNAINFSANATKDDGSCVFQSPQTEVTAEPPVVDEQTQPSPEATAGEAEAAPTELPPAETPATETTNE